MALLRLTASADTTISNATKTEGLDTAIYANMGAADSLEIFALPTEDSETKKSRILIRFDNNKISLSRAAGQIPASGSVKFYLNLKNVQHPFPTPEQLTFEVSPLSASWDEGYGLDLDHYTDTGIYADAGAGVNWVYRTIDSGNAISWNSPGGDYLTQYSVTGTVEGASTDLQIDVTEIVEEQLLGNIENYGFIVKLDASQELDNSGISYFTKRFSARTSEYFYGRPYLEARWDSSQVDSRMRFYYVSPNLEEQENSGSIFFYNRIGGKLRNLPGDVTPQVKILLDGQQVMSTDGEKVATGTYKVTFAITGSEEAEYSDVWYSGSYAYYTGSISAMPLEVEQAARPDSFIFAITNLKQQYSTEEVALFKVFSRKKDWSPTIYTVASKDIENYVHNKLYYKIYRLEDNLVVIDYGYPPENATRCSSDAQGNYFSVDMSLLQPGYTYAIRLSLHDDAQIFEDPNIYKFKVIKYATK